MGHGACRHRLHLPLLPRAAHCNTALGSHFVATHPEALVLEVHRLSAGLFWVGGRCEPKFHGVGENFEG